MKIVQRGNKQLRVDDNRLEEMLEAGYALVDEETGRLIEPNKEEDGSKALKKENAALKKENKALEEQLAALLAQGPPAKE